MVVDPTWSKDRLGYSDDILDFFLVNFSSSAGWFGPVDPTQITDRIDFVGSRDLICWLNRHVSFVSFGFLLSE